MLEVIAAISSLLSLLEAGGAVVRGLEKLSSLREALVAILALNNEVTDFRVVIIELSSILRQEPENFPGSADLSQSLKLLLERAKERILELECLI